MENKTIVSVEDRETHDTIVVAHSDHKLARDISILFEAWKEAIEEKVEEGEEFFLFHFAQWLVDNHGFERIIVSEFISVDTSELYEDRWPDELSS